MKKESAGYLKMSEPISQTAWCYVSVKSMILIFIAMSIHHNIAKADEAK